MAALLFFLLLVVSLAVPAAAAEAGISVEPLLPPNQTDPSKSYFDLILQPGEQQELTVKVNNTGAYDVEVAVETVTASTSENGMINYTTPPQWNEQSLQHPFAELAQATQERVSIPAGGSEQVVVLVNMPAEPVEGVILGSIHIVQETVEETDGALSHQFAYAIAVQLANGDERVSPAFALGDVLFAPQGDRAAVSAGMRNISPAVAKEISVNAALYDEDGVPYLFHTIERLEMAPNSIYPLLMVDEMGMGLDPGDYRLEVHLDYGGEELLLEHPVSLSADQLKGLVYERSSEFHVTGILRVLLFILGTIVVVAVLIILGLLLYVNMQNRKYYAYIRQQQKRKLEQERREQKEQQEKPGKPGPFDQPQPPQRRSDDRRRGGRDR